MTTYSQFACIGSGFSGIGLGATLKRWYGIHDIAIFERHADLGGTWFANKYPGAGCDVPSILYSFSFASEPSWSEVMAPYAELQAYLQKVSNQYDLIPKITFQATVKRCEWIEDRSRWRLTIHDGKSDTIFQHECQFLYSGTGILVEPREPDIPGVDTFEGPLFHPSRWPDNISLKDKDVVVVGNGCTATQIVPAIADDARSVTQYIRSKHWIIPPVLPREFEGILPPVRFLFRWVPGFMGLVRLAIFLGAENDWRGFLMTKDGERYRKSKERWAIRYTKKHAPEEYHDRLIPDFPFGCKRRIHDPGYLDALHKDNVDVLEEPILEVVPEGVRTKDGVRKADVIVMANGYSTNTFLPNIEVVGKYGKTLTQHWDEFGGPEAYNSVLVSGFPNFFMLLGPNTATGHTSTILAIENAINYTMRIIKPILDTNSLTVDVKREAEQRDVDEIQAALQKTVWHMDCKSWYARDANGNYGRNSSTYPYTQPRYWWKCLFPKWNDLRYTPAPNQPKSNKLGKALKLVLWALVFVSTRNVINTLRQNDWDVKISLAMMALKLQMLKTKWIK